MSHPANDRLYDDLRDRREEFLERYDASEQDVDKDDEGREYLEAQPGDRLYLPSMEDYGDDPPEED